MESRHSSISLQSLRKLTKNLRLGGVAVEEEATTPTLVVHNSIIQLHMYL